MKKISFLLIAITAFGTGARAQQTPTGGPNPQYLNTIYFWAADSLLSLEKTTGQVKNKMRYFGAGSGPSYVMDGPRSAIRIRATSDSRFVVKLSGMMDPSSMIKLYRFEGQKKSRETSMNQGNKNVVDCNVQKSGADVYILIPSAKLSPGEYGFQNMMMMNGAGSTQMSYTFFAFGVDQ